MTALVDDLKKNQIVLSILESNNYNDTIVDTIKNIPKDANVVYITLNKTASSLESYLSKFGISTERFTIIDCITKTITDIKDTDRVIYLESPRSLSDLSFILTGVLKSKDHQYLIFDSLTTLMVYQDKPIVVRFVLNIVNRIRATTCKSILFAVNLKEHKDFLKEISIFVDHVINVRGEKE